MAKFFNINNSIFNAENVIAVHQQTRTVEVERTVAVVFVNHGRDVEEHTVVLPEGKQLSDFVDDYRINQS